MITEARVEMLEQGAWIPAPGFSTISTTIPHAIEEGRLLRAHELRSECFSYKPAPIRVVDSSGTVVAQWGKA